MFLSPRKPQFAAKTFFKVATLVHFKKLKFEILIPYLLANVAYLTTPDFSAGEHLPDTSVSEADASPLEIFSLFEGSFLNYVDHLRFFDHLPTSS